MPKINAAGLALIKSFEGCDLDAYPDPGSGGQPYTIGWGHTGGVTPGEVWTQAQADSQLEADLIVYEKGVNDDLTHSINPNQFAALVSFAYNDGLGALKASTLLELVNAGDYAGATQQFGRWINGANGPMPGLIRRRAAEAKLFNTPG